MFVNNESLPMTSWSKISARREWLDAVADELSEALRVATLAGQPGLAARIETARRTAIDLRARVQA